MGVARDREGDARFIPELVPTGEMSFPLADWVDGHADCRYNFGSSGMLGTIPAPVPTAAEVERADEGELRERLARDLDVDTGRVFLTTGASQANALAILFLALQGRGGRGRSCRVCFPEYPPIFDTARWAGFRLTASTGPVDLAVLSQPRNPEGDLWEKSRVLDWASGAKSVLVDETFREFAETPTLLRSDLSGLWATGSFTKFYAADELRAGFLVVPEEHRPEFDRFYGLVRNPLAPYSIAGALRALNHREEIRRQVRAVLRANLQAVRKSFPGRRPPVAPMMFDRPESGEDGDSLARRALEQSVLVSPGSLFGDRSGVRLCLSRRTVPTDLAAYLAVRDRTAKRPLRRSRST